MSSAAPAFRIEATVVHLGGDGADLARVRLRLGDRSLSQFHEVDTDRVRDWVTTSPVALALWFADNWWRLRWEPIRGGRPTPDWRLRHELSSASSSRLWPPLMIYGAGERMVFGPAAGAPLETGPLRYIDPPVSVCAASEYEAGLDLFFDQARSDASGAADASALASMLSELSAERSDPDQAAWRRLEARLGYDVDAAPATLMQEMIRLEDSVGQEAVEEAAVAVPGEHAPGSLRQSVEATRSSAVIVDLSIARQAQAHSSLPLPPWRQAEDAAWRLRSAIGREEGPLLAKALADTLQVRWEAVAAATATARTLPYAGRLSGRGDAVKLSLQTLKPHDRRYELARALGDAVWNIDAPFSPLTKGKTDRQKFSRAFAQSLLCPFHELRKHVTLEAPTELEMHAAARYFHVNVGVIRTLLVNKGILPRETLDERVEAA